MKWMMLMVMALCLLAALAYGAYLKRDTVAVWLGLAEAKPELSKTPLFKPMERFVISLEGDREPHYLVLELALVTHNPQQLETLNELTPPDPQCHGAIFQPSLPRCGEAGAAKYLRSADLSARQAGSDTARVWLQALSG